MNNRAKRKNPRLREYDYSQPGYYFVTISAAERRIDLFSQLVPPEPAVGAASLGGPHVEAPVAILTPLGDMVREHIEKIDFIYGNARVDMYAIMPDHIHLIIQILDPADGPPREAAPTAAVAKGASVIKILDSLKGITSHKAGRRIWQRSFFDHIIRNDTDLYNARRYVKYNASKHLLNQEEGHDTHA